jgi:DNA-binding response OmpR family regulator
MKKIILLEDDNDIATIVKLGIGSQYDVQVINDFSDVIEKVLAHLPDLIIADYVLGQFVSTEIIAEMRATSKLNATPVILLTGHPRIEQIAAEMNVTGCLMKPFALADLHTSIAKALLVDGQGTFSPSRHQNFE